jgi:hypothetical protein
MARPTTGLCALMMLAMVAPATPFASQSPAAPHAVIWRDPGDMASLDLFYRAGGKGQITRNIPRADAKWLGHRPSMLSAAQVRDGFRAAGYTRQEVETYTEAMRKRIAEFQAL